DRLSAAIAQQLAVRVAVAALLAVGQQVPHQGGRDRLPSYGLALLAQPDEALVDVEVAWAEGKRTTAAARRLGVQSQQQGVQFGIVAGGAGYLVDPSELGVWQGTAGAGKAARLRDPRRGIVTFGDQAVRDGVPVKTAQCGDQVFGGRPAAAGVPSADDLALGA